jgi:hypothetical protein
MNDDSHHQCDETQVIPKIQKIAVIDQYARKNGISKSTTNCIPLCGCMYPSDLMACIALCSKECSVVTGIHKFEWKSCVVLTYRSACFILTPPAALIIK